MIKAFGCVYLTEEEMENKTIMAKYAPKDERYDTPPLLARPYEKEVSYNGFRRTITFGNSGYNRKERRKLMYTRKYNTRGLPAGYGAHTKPVV